MVFPNRGFSFVRRKKPTTRLLSRTWDTLYANRTSRYRAPNGRGRTARILVRKWNPYIAMQFKTSGGEAALWIARRPDRLGSAKRAILSRRKATRSTGTPESGTH